MVALPSFFSFSWTLPYIPTISLPANIQRRFLSYVLKRALGRFVKAGGLDVERIQAQISEGWVEIEGLEVNTEEVNSLLPPGIPLTLSSGTLSKVTAQVPFPNLWSDPLSITLDTVFLDFKLSPISSKGKTPETPPGFHRAKGGDRSSPLDLASSVTEAADDFLHEELDAYEEAELDHSIRQSLILSQNDPFTQDELPGAFPGAPSGSSPGVSSPMSPGVESTTVLAGLVERILARLQMRVKNIRVRCQYDHDKYGAIFELRVGEASYADETKPVADGLPKQTTRSVRITSVEIYMLSSPQRTATASSTPDRHRFLSTTSRSSSTSSTSSSDSDAGAELYMSQAVADLRESTATSLASGASVYQSATQGDLYHSASGKSVYRNTLGASVYQSALNERAEMFEEGVDPEEDEHSRSSTPTPTGHKTEEEALLLSFGSDDIVLQMTTTPSALPNPGPQPSAVQFTSTAAPGANAARPQPAGDASSILPSVDLGVSCGTIAIFLLPAQAMRLTAALQSVTRKSPADQPVQAAEFGSKFSLQPRINASVRMKALYACCVYDVTVANSPQLPASVAAFWNKPSTSNITFGHIKIRLEDLAGSYSSKGSFPISGAHRSPLSNIQQPRPLNRRGSTYAQLGPPPPAIVLTLSDASIFEYLAVEQNELGGGDEPPGGAFPVLVFDHGLPRQYDALPVGSAPFSPSAPRLSAPTPAFPEFECVDWRNSGLQKGSGGGEKAWKIRPKGRGVLKGVSSVPGDERGGPAVSISNSSSRGTGLNINLAPVHVFLDLSLVERLLPMLRSIAPVIRSPQPSPSTPVAVRKELLTPQSVLINRTSQFVIDDLEAQASQQAARQEANQFSSSLVAKCPLIRLDIRCPAPLNRRGSWGDGAHLRSGIVTLDIHDLIARLRSDRRPKFAQTARQTVDSGNVTTVDWQKMIFFFCRVPDKQSSAFLVIGPLAPDPGDVSGGDVLLPTVDIKASDNPITNAKTQLVTIRVPSIQAKIRQRVIEGLQFFADDMTHWLDGAFGDGSAPKPRDDLKMIGSRFFGAKTSSSASSLTEDDDDDDEDVATMLRLVISEVDIALHVPRLKAETARILSLHGSDVDVKVESNIAGKKETALSVTVMDADFTDKSESSTPIRILARSTPLSLTMHTQPLLQLRFSSLMDDATGAKETGINVIGSSFTFFVTKDYAWIHEMASFAKTPEGVFEDVVPSEVTRVTLQLYDTSVHATAPNLSGAVVAVFGNVEVKTDIISDAGESVVDAVAEGIHLLLIDDTSASSQLSSGHTSSSEAWKKAGYAPLVDVVVLESQLSRDLTVSKDVMLDVIRSQVKISACADSVATFGLLISDLAKMAPAAPDPEPRTSAAALAESIDVFSSVDESAFTRVPEIISGADLIEDDLPTNLDYLDQATRHSNNAASVDRMTGETLRTWEATGDSFDDANAKFTSEVNGETVKILIQEAFEVEEDYWDSLPVVNNGFVDDTRVGNIRVRVQDCSVGVFLYDGFDWQKTRKVIEDEIKAVRRRLERIRQLLAAGQKADESFEKTGSMLFNSVYIGLDQSRGDLDSAALLAAIDEELEELGAETASQSSWQTNFPPAADRPTHKKTRLKGRRLTRSKKAQIEVNLSGIKADVDIYAPDDAMASRVHVTVKELEILDHIKTSTWKKFLTEMKADSRGNVRETDADMVRVELVAVRPSLPMSSDQELRLRAKILPLRLHVDQDALDFLKRFGSFSAPVPDAPAAPMSPGVQKAAAQEPFFQHVEVFPIEMKLDYKPKRVDFGALREGKTMELMNFFHFDGAEMTLRHITLSGVTGVTRLSNLLQDIWTPDVKANQLADVISGVSPIRSMVNVGSGVADLILLPIEQYRKDGRVARGVQRGTNSFVRSTALEMMKLGARLATGTQVILEKAEGVLGGKFGESVIGEVETDPALAGEHGWEEHGSSSEDEAIEVVSRYANQPGDVREGVQAAYQSLSRNVNAAAQTILAVPMEVYERSGDDGPLRAVVRAVPIAVLKPMIGASEAVSKTLLGMRNSLDPQGRREQSDKYK
ncbi:hypothetical protein BCR39DRAFT_553281 [Naematelia encephala]|uniref:Autophagy-related protein 2 n=1 Tax=Naematelia encephala TaxID=71784 RepID=A0A1Y2AGB0_9TREE|nr:hypothetical protein BCR39DRAFT_553281 [Naematelia encephala]